MTDKNQTATNDGDPLDLMMNVPRKRTICIDTGNGQKHDADAELARQVPDEEIQAAIAVPSLCAWCSDQENIDRQNTVHLTCPECGKEVHQSGNLRSTDSGGRAAITTKEIEAVGWYIHDSPERINRTAAIKAWNKICDAIAALRNRKPEPCEWCDLEPSEQIFAYGMAFSRIPVNFCPSCGRQIGGDRA